MKRTVPARVSPVPDMTYNVFDGTLHLALSICLARVKNGYWSTSVTSRATKMIMHCMPGLLREGSQLRPRREPGGLGQTAW